MGCDVADLPEWRDGLQVPFAGFERTQQVYEFAVHPAEEVGTEDGVETVGCHVWAFTLQTAFTNSATVLGDCKRRTTPPAMRAAEMAVPTGS